MQRILTLFVLLGASLTASAAQLSETIDRTVDVRPGAVVTLSNVNGKVSVGSWDQPRVRIVARKQVRGDAGDLEEVLRALRVEIQPQAGGVTITTHHPKRRGGGSGVFDWILGSEIQADVQYEITVPRRMDLDLRNTNGAITVRGVEGSLEVATTNGKIALLECGGTVDASTTNGQIRAELKSVMPARTMTLSTTNGRIDLVVPGTLSAEIDASTTNGSIVSDLPVSTTRISRNSLRGSVNGGGPSIRLRTTNGGIGIRAAS